MATPHIIALAALVILAQYNPAGPNGPWAPRQPRHHDTGPHPARPAARLETLTCGRSWASCS
jgi:hypothetical protein